MHQAELAATALKAAGFMVGPISENTYGAIVPFTNGALKEIGGQEKMLWATVVVHNDTDEPRLSAKIEAAIRHINIAVNQ